MNPEALVQLIVELEPEAQALVTLLVQHLRHRPKAAPAPTPVPVDVTPAAPPARENQVPLDVASTSLDPNIPEGT